MPERLKDLYFTHESIAHLAESVAGVYPGFDQARFLSLVFAPGWEALELKGQMHRVSRALRETLPDRFADALPILKAAVPEIHGFEAMVFPDYVEMYGQEEWDLAVPALAFFTRFASAEFAIRPFLEQNPERALPYLLDWAEDPNPEVRRLASEGCRPRLPWASALNKFKADPTPILPILEKLKDDPAETVRRSVANNLNDIAKDHPEVTLSLCEAWSGYSPRTDRMIKHACRGLLKAGNRRALALFGLGGTENLSIEDLKFGKTRIRLGESLDFSYFLIVGGKDSSKVRLEYGLDFVKARGHRTRKIFQISEKEYAPGSYHFEKRHLLVDRSTRKHYPGLHVLAILVNGEEMASASFLLEVGRRSIPRDS